MQAGPVPGIGLGGGRGIGMEGPGVWGRGIGMEGPGGIGMEGPVVWGWVKCSLGS